MAAKGSSQDDSPRSAKLEQTSTAQPAKQAESVLPEDLDAELDIEVESDGNISLESLGSDLEESEDGGDALDVDDIDDDDIDDEFGDDFSSELSEEGDEELDLTEDLSEELGPEKFFRDSESNLEDDEEDIPRSW